MSSAGHPCYSGDDGSTVSCRRWVHPRSRGVRLCRWRCPDEASDCRGFACRRDRWPKSRQSRYARTARGVARGLPRPVECATRPDAHPDRSDHRCSVRRQRRGDRLPASRGPRAGGTEAAARRVRAGVRDWSRHPRRLEGCAGRDRSASSPPLPDVQRAAVFPSDHREHAMDAPRRSNRRDDCRTKPRRLQGHRLRPRNEAAAGRTLQRHYDQPASGGGRTIARSRGAGRVHRARQRRRLPALVRVPAVDPRH